MKVNLIIYYDVKTINNFTKLINVLIKYPPRYYTYIYIHGIILSEYYITNIKKFKNIIEHNC